MSKVTWEVVIICDHHPIIMITLITEELYRCRLCAPMAFIRSLRKLIVEPTFKKGHILNPV